MNPLLLIHGHSAECKGTLASDIINPPCRLVISDERLRRFIRPHQTMVIDIEIPRLPSAGVVKAVKASIESLEDGP